MQKQQELTRVEIDLCQIRVTDQVDRFDEALALSPRCGRMMSSPKLRHSRHALTARQLAPAVIMSRLARPGGTIGKTFSSPAIGTLMRQGPGWRSASARAAEGFSALPMSIARTPNPRRDGDEVRAAQTGSEIAAAVEELLLLAHHSQLGVVEQDDFNLDALLGGSGKFLHVHEELPSPPKQATVRPGQPMAAPMAARQAEAHRAQAPRKSAIGAAA